MPLSALSVDATGRFLERDGKPFFLLGDTIWEMAHRLDAAEIETYAAIRSAQGFNAALFCLLAELDGLRTPNRQGATPLHDLNPERPNEAYFAFVDRAVEALAARGIYSGLLPAWGDKWNRGTGEGPEIFTPANARAYGIWLGRRYAGRPVFWVLGGDRRAETETHRAVLAAMAEGLREGGARQLRTFHPMGQWDGRGGLADPAWLDFVMNQSGHCHEYHPNFRLIERDYARRPAKPVLDGEPCYERHPVMTPSWKRTERRFDAHACRRALYWAVFSGACGHVYGAHPVWQCHAPERTPEVNGAHWHWREALHFEGATHSGFVHRLLPFEGAGGWFPARDWIASQPAQEIAHVVACRDAEGRRLLAYTPFAQSVELAPASLGGARWRFRWWHPAAGADLASGTLEGGGTTLHPPAGGLDWVLRLDRV